MFKNIIILVLASTLSIGGYFVKTTIDALEAAIKSMQMMHKKDIAKTKIKERGKRYLTVVPIVGLAAAGWFEKQEYDEWKTENPNGTPEDYASEVTSLIKEIANDYWNEIKVEKPELRALINKNENG